MEIAHDSDEFLWLVFIMWQMAPNQFKAVLDNVSLCISGHMSYPKEAGLLPLYAMMKTGMPKPLIPSILMVILEKQSGYILVEYQRQGIFLM